MASRSIAALPFSPSECFSGSIPKALLWVPLVGTRARAGDARAGSSSSPCLASCLYQSHQNQCFPLGTELGSQPRTCSLTANANTRDH